MRYFWSLILAVHLHAAAAGEVVLNLEPTKEFPRNSEGAFITLKSGHLLYLYTQFYGGASDHSAARIVALESQDGGRTWSREPRTLLENHQGANVMSVSLLRLQSGRIALFYLLKNTWLDCRPHVCFSDDEAATWSEPVRMLEAPGYFVLNNDRVIQHRSGRLIAPLASHRARNADPETSKSFDSRAIALWVISDDEGKTWKEAPQWQALPVPSTRTGLQEPGIVELEDGSLLSFFRTDQGVQYECRSKDRGESWTPVAPGPLNSPASPASLKRLPRGSALLAVWNDHSGDFPFVEKKRTPLVIGLSDDGGHTWSAKKVIESDPEGWYCYTALHFVEDAVLLAYCAGDAHVGGLNRLRIRRIEWADLK
ncbi:BNR repeat-like domain-containing protein [Prosthecobacter debontii]|uniref:BNR repeat-like domain-containing protein n=1 Tax=Prosthecobacter debontii TaxID=48467 RepID=A0A1T4YSK5_9BACT|nr:sialidase family protein [Prosthecobacter debontii]SKB04643.1 BNR repeat-like domain-containing protein [Prosthecobacter debontii]